MAGLIKRGDIDEVRQRVNIADVVGDYVTLKSAGVGSMKGLCPFHDERSPSFHVRPQAGFYHCFGCGEGGDVYSFLQKIDHLSFQESVERLAERVGYQLTYEEGGGAAPAGNRARLYAVNQAAEKFFRAQLGTPEAEPGRTFLGERGFDALAAERFAESVSLISIGLAKKRSLVESSPQARSLSFLTLDILWFWLPLAGLRCFAGCLVVAGCNKAS